MVAKIAGYHAIGFAIKQVIILFFTAFEYTMFLKIELVYDWI